MIYSFQLNNKVIIVTGGYGYLGKAITESLIFHGAIVYVFARNYEKFLNAFSENTELDNKLHFQLCDISDTLSISSAFKNVYERESRIDVLINNAVYTKGQSPESITDEEWFTGVDGTLSSIFRSIREIIPYFKKQLAGKIINVSSMYGIVSPDFEIYKDHPEFLNPPHYGAAKAGTIHLSKYYASYLGKIGITVNTITPGPFPSTEVQKSTEFITELSKHTLLNRVGKPEDLAGAFVFLASDASNFITGQNIIIDGGWTTK
jgi:gluconate 5-dehydrogenase